MVVGVGCVPEPWGDVPHPLPASVLSEGKAPPCTEELEWGAAERVAGATGDSLMQTSPVTVTRVASV